MKKILRGLSSVVALCLCIVTLAACNKPVETTATPTVDPSITPAPTEAPADIDPSTVDVITQQWVATEISFVSSTEYTKPLDDAELDVTFTAADGTVIKMPGFWDGGTTWKVRFAPTVCGVWTYTTSCTDAANTGLNGITGKVGCNAYKGDLAIYQHGFIKTEANKRYFMYADGTPFFYLGDTHWSIGLEELDSSEKEGIASQFKYIVDKRVEQGFTVYQSEPIGAKYSFANGVSKADIKGLQDMDARFQYIAEKGMVHANAEFFYSSDVTMKKYTEAYLAQLCRLWVARYGAYPVMWTCAQECDNDFYYDRDDGQKSFTAETNPWKFVATKINELDPYKHPLTAHQEYASMDPEHGCNATRSAFRDVAAHTWYAAQWTPSNNAGLDFTLLKDFWENGQGKPIVNYEGSYENLWTIEKGAREQGWTAFLNGMCGQGYGAIDIWLYNSTYDMKEDSVRGNFTITVEMKKTKWYDSVNFATATQLGVHMQNFLKSVGWWNLEPSFDDPQAEHFAFFSAWYAAAHISNETYVAYFYNTNTTTGKITGLASGKTYTAQWFNPRTGEYSAIASDITGQAEKSYWQIPDKPDTEDWVLLVTINK